MADPVPMTLRIDSELKGAAEKAAEAQGISLTEFVQRSLRSSTTPVCAQCGRSAVPAVMPAGFSDGFNQFLEEVPKYGAAIPLVFITEECGQPVVYWVKLDLASRRDALANSGVVMVHVIFDRGSKTIGIPRAWIVGWSFDQDGRLFETYRSLGYVDGNTRMSQRPPVSVSPRRGGRG
jgi:hypothetical protein